MNATRFMKPMQNWVLLLAVATLITTLPAKAQESLQRSSSAQPTLNARQPSRDYNVLHVNAATGNDQQGTGSAEQPYKTITRALHMAPATSTVILLAPGHYNQASGEQFPLRLRPGLTIQGSTGEARNTLIVGSGEVQGDNATHNATIVTADRSGLANVTVSNPKGSGVWITAGSPVLRRIALVSNTIAGIQVNDGAPVIESSYFHSNQYGLTIQGNGRAIVRGNYFDATGRAISVASPATPVINNNRIARNHVGIALKNNARPILEANVLNDNARNGVVEVEPTTAVFPPLTEESNAIVKHPETSHEEHESAVSSQPQTVALTQLDAATNRNAREEPAIFRRFETSEQGAISSPNITDSNAILPTIGATSENIADESSSTGEEEPVDEIASSRQQLDISSSAPAPVTPTARQSRQIESPETDTAAATEVVVDSAIPIAVIPANEPNSTRNSTRRAGIAKLLARLNGSNTGSSDPEAVSGSEEPAPSEDRSPLENSNISITPPLELPPDSSTAPNQLLPVPLAAVSSRDSASRLPPPSAAPTETFRYRVLVDVENADDLQNLVPDAFRTRVGSRVYMQAGAYVEEAEAQARLEWLQENGIDGQVDLRN